MIPILTVAQIKHAEQQAIDGGRSVDDLMRQAGTGVAEAIDARRIGDSAAAVVLCGPGKNGGDGIVVACALVERGWSVAVWTFDREGVGDAPVDADSADAIEWLESGAQLAPWVRDADIVVDAVFGVGGRSELPDAVRDVFATVQAARRSEGVAIWSLDLPSGMDADSGDIADGALEADATAMIGLPKIGAFRFPAASHTGEIIHIDIGLEPPTEVDSTGPQLISERFTRSSIPLRRAGAHKRSVGTVLVVGGSPHFHGAPRLACEAALRSGAGLVTLAAPSSILANVAITVPEVTFLPLPSGDRSRTGERMAEAVRTSAPDYDTLLIGPGLGLEPPVPDFLSSLFGMTRVARVAIGFGFESRDHGGEPFAGRAVVDADALNFLATQDGWWEAISGADLVLTPHPKELSRLLGCEVDDVLADPWDSARRAASNFGQVVVLKHGHSVVATPDGRLLIAPQATPALATAGSGDVLAGVIASLMSQGLASVDAAACGLVVGLRAAENASMWRGELGLVATDLVSELPAAIRHFTEPRV